MKLLEIKGMRGGVYTIVDEDVYNELKGKALHRSHKGYVRFSKWSKDENKVKSIILHRHIMNAPKGVQVDHINGDKLDNRRCNLRMVTNQQNQMNSKKQSNSTQKYKGIEKISVRFRARICIDGKRMGLGMYDSAEEAAKAYNEKAKELFGEYARLNEL